MIDTDTTDHTVALKALAIALLNFNQDGYFLTQRPNEPQFPLPVSPQYDGYKLTWRSTTTHIGGGDDLGVVYKLNAPRSGESWMLYLSRVAGGGPGSTRDTLVKAIQTLADQPTSRTITVKVE